MADSSSDDDADLDDPLLRRFAAIPRRDRAGDEDDADIPARIGPFRVEGKLGRGAMGIVVAAEDERLLRKVALKLLPRTAIGDEARRARFLREARSASAVTHPAIATVYEVGEADGAIFIAMERVSGATLRARLAGGALAIPEVVRVGAALASALAKAHAAGVVHRDLKPENVMIDDEGAVKILDFGLAKLLDAGASGEAIAVAGGPLDTQTGHVLGTPSYMSPEQARGDAVDGRSDVFALGVVLYELATGARPFRGATARDVIEAIQRAPPERASSRRRDLPPVLDRLIARCLSKSPEDRPRDAKSLAIELDAIAQPSRSWRPIAIAAVAPLAVTALALAFLSTRGRARSAETTPAATSREHTVVPAPLDGSAPPTSATAEEASAAPATTASRSAPSSATATRHPASRATASSAVAAPSPTAYDPLAHQK